MHSKDKEAHLRKIVERNTDRLCRKHNVVGVGAGTKYVNGVPTGEDAILVFVSNKQPLQLLDPRDIIESAIDGVKTDVVGKVGRIHACYNLDANVLNLKSQALNMAERPIPAGVSISHLYVTAGTLGGYFLDRQNEVVLLSNQHVIAGEAMQGKFGPAPKRGNVILQPGTFDGGNLNNVFANLKSWVPLKKKNNYEDSAIAVVGDLTKIKNEVKGLGKIKGFGAAFVGQQVQKVGRSTGKTTGSVISTKAAVCVEYGTNVRCFNDCIITTNMSAGGDSGSLLLDMDMRVVGLLFAGSNAVTIYNPINYPVKTYGLKIWHKP